MYCGMPKYTPQADQAVVLAVIELRLSEGISQSAEIGYATLTHL